MPFIGIDLGTTYTCVATQQRGKIEVIANEHGNRTTPSCVAFADGKRLVGEAAQHQRSRNPANTVYDAKRLIGRSYRDPAVQSDKRRWQFIVENEDGKPKIQVEHKKQMRKFAPEQISSMVLHQMKKCAENFLGEGVLGAVITVPAYFNDAQRRATRDAATIADLHVLGLLNEPTAAAIAYGLQKDVKEKRNVLIFDLGGGTFDVTVLTIQGEDFEVKATSGDTHLGGQDFNDRLFNHFAAALAQKHGVDIKNDARARSRLMDACEKTKRTLSTAKVADIHLDGLVKKEDFSTHITRVRFEQLNEDLFRGTLETVGKALEDAQMKKEKVEEVVLVGGSTRIPRIQELIKGYFGGAKICKTINPEEAVATGAAAYAASLSKKPTPKARKFNLRDVIPLSLGIETKGEFMTVVVGRNTQIPVQKTHNFTTVKDNQKVVDFRVFEGERPNTKQNHLLDNFLVHEIPLAPAGKPVLETCFDIDKDGVLTVSAKETRRGNKGSITITQESRKKNEKEIKQMVEEARRFREEDEAWKEKTFLVNRLAEGALRAKKAIEKLGTGRQSAADRRALTKCDDALHRNNHDLTVEELTAMIKEFEEMRKDME